MNQPALLVLGVLLTRPAAVADWQTLPVPGCWEEVSAGRLSTHDGFAWYRCRIAVPASWGDRDLTLVVGLVDNAHEIWLDGERLGGAGRFPPHYAAGLGREQPIAIPRALVRASEDQLLSIRVYDDGGRGGFRGGAPVVFAGDEAISLEGRWQFRVGDDTAWASEAATSAPRFERVLRGRERVEELRDFFEYLRNSSTAAEMKPQSKVWRHAGSWWCVVGGPRGTWLWRLDGAAWTRILQVSTSFTVRADCLARRNVTHVLLFDGVRSELVSVEYVDGSPGTYQTWTTRPSAVAIPLSRDAETATIDVDTTGRMWLASDAATAVEVRVSDAPYTDWSAPIVLCGGIGVDDICAVGAIPDGSVGVLWSNQVEQRFGFRVHLDGDPPETWSADEVPASPSAQKVGLGMADDHLNFAVASDGTLYAAVKTSYDTAGFPRIALLVRRPSGDWDPLHEVDQTGTRGIVVLDESAGTLRVVYTSSEGFNDIVYRETSTASIRFGARQTLLEGDLNNATSTKRRHTGELVILANGWAGVTGVHMRTAPSTEGAPATRTLTFNRIASDPVVPLPSPRVWRF